LSEGRLPALPAQTRQQPQFEAVVNRVRVDVIVTDEQGEFVADLEAKDFRLFEDEVEQQVLQIQLVDLDAGFITDLSLPSSTTIAGETERADPDHGATTESSLVVADFGAMVYLLDVGRLGYWERRRFARGWAELLDQTESYGFPRAVYMIDYLGYLRELAPLTRDVEVLRAVSSDFLTAVNTLDDQDWLFEHPDWQTDQSSARDEGGQDAYSRIRSRVVARNTAGFLSAVCNSLLGRRGRKALVWVSQGVALSRGGMTDATALEAWETLERDCNAANASIYGLDPTLVTARQKYRPWTRINLDRRVDEGPAESLARDPLESRLADFDALRDSLILAANGTGGKAYTFQTRVGQVLQEIETDTARFYLLTYATPAPLGDGEFHELRVEVERPGLQVRARRGYFDHAEQERRDLVAASSLALPGSVADLPVQAGAFYNWTADGEPQAQIAIDVRGVIEALGTTPERPSLQLYFAVVSDNRELIASSSQTVSWPAKTEGPGTSEPMAPPVYLHPWTLGFGRFDVRILAIDEDSGRMGSARVALQIPEQQSEPLISHPVLIAAERDRMGPPVPVLDGLVSPDADVQAFLEVYGETEVVVEGWIASTEGAPGAAEQAASAERRMLEVDVTSEPESPIRKVWLSLPADLTPGSYVISVQVRRPAGEDRQDFEIPLRVEH
jgi:VWFA-related protein